MSSTGVGFLCVYSTYIFSLSFKEIQRIFSLSFKEIGERVNGTRIQSRGALDQHYTLSCREIEIERKRKLSKRKREKNQQKEESKM